MKRDQQKDLKRLADAFFAKLLITNTEYGGIGLDPTRPFGNSSVERDMLELLGAEPEGDDGEDKCFSSEQREYVSGLYHERLIPYLRSRWQELDRQIQSVTSSRSCAYYQAIDDAARYASRRPDHEWSKAFITGLSFNGLAFSEIMPGEDFSLYPHGLPITAQRPPEPYFDDETYWSKSAVIVWI